MSRIDIAAVPPRKQSGIHRHSMPRVRRTWRRLGDAGGLLDFGINPMTLSPGDWSGQRHWHSDEDEFVDL
ncbi:MAG: hypothetical protein ABIS07_09050 [Dokdonella sp.]